MPLPANNDPVRKKTLFVFHIPLRYNYKVGSSPALPGRKLIIAKEVVDVAKIKNRCMLCIVNCCHGYT
jgi:hypothetical protein